MAESQARATEGSLAVLPANYKFKYKGLVQLEGRKAHLFHVSPRKKRNGLFVGELWLDADSHLPVRESGRLVKSPSIFLRKIEFVREYRIQGGVAIPSRIRSSVETRLVGKTHLSVEFSAVSLAERTQAVPAGDSQ